MAASFSRAALATAPVLDRDVSLQAPRARPTIPRCLKAAIGSRRSAEFPRRCHQRLAAVERPRTATTATPPPSPPSPLPPQHPLDAEASELRRALSNRGASPTPDRVLLDRARDLALSIAAATRGSSERGAAAASPEAAAFLDALGGAVARGLEGGASPSPPSPPSSSPSFGPSPSSAPPYSISSLEGSARLLKAYAQAGHRTLAASELARAVVRQACRALLAAAAGGSVAPCSAPPLPPPPVPVFSAAASIARSVACMGIYPGARLMEALSSSAVAFSATRRSSSSGGGGTAGPVSSSGGATTDSDGEEAGSGSGGSRPPRLASGLPASAVVDWLCAAAAARHALPRALGALAATARFNPIQAAAAAAALASLGSGGGGGGASRSCSSSPSSGDGAPPVFSTLVSTLRSRVAGSPRGGVPPRAAVAAAWALASWGELDDSSAAALAEHAEAGIAVSAPSSSSSSPSSSSSSNSSSSPANNPSLLSEGDLVSLWGALRAAGWRAAVGEAGETEARGGSGGAGEEEEEAAPVAAAVRVLPRETSAVFPSARAARAASAARAAAVAAAAEATARGPPAEISRLSELLSERLLQPTGARVAVVAPSADGCALWRVEAEVGGGGGGGASPAVSLVALSPSDNASSNHPVVALGLASVELNAAAEERRRRSPAAGAELSFRGLLFAGAGDGELEALAAAVEEALAKKSRSSSIVT